MYKVLCSAVVLLGLVSLVGCGPDPDALMQRQIDEMNELADALESGAAQAKLDAIGQRLKETKTAAEGLDLSDEEKKRLLEKYGTAAAKATARLAQASLSKMGGAMKEMANEFQQGMQSMPKSFGMP